MHNGTIKWDSDPGDPTLRNGKFEIAGAGTVQPPPETGVHDDLRPALYLKGRKEILVLPDWTPGSPIGEGRVYLTMPEACASELRGAGLSPGWGEFNGEATFPVLDLGGKRLFAPTPCGGRATGTLVWKMLDGRTREIQVKECGTCVVPGGELKPCFPVGGGTNLALLDADADANKPAAAYRGRVAEIQPAQAGVDTSTQTRVQSSEEIVIHLNRSTVSIARAEPCTSGYGLHITFTDAGMRQMKAALAGQTTVLMVNEKVLSREFSLGPKIDREMFWVRSVGTDEMTLEEAQALAREIMAK
jgi:hypothetical protein